MAIVALIIVLVLVLVGIAMAVDKNGNYYTLKKKKGKDGNMYSYPSYGTKRAPAKRSGGGGGGGGGGRSYRKPSKDRPSFIKWFTLSALGIAAASATGYGAAQAELIEAKAMELASLLGIASGAGLAAAVGALYWASSTRNKDVPIVGSVGTAWKSYLATMGWRR
jgi:hypothetical protein